MVKNLPASAGDAREGGSIPGLGRSPEGRHGNLLLYSCLENPMDKEPGGLESIGHKEEDTLKQLRRFTHNKKD